MIPLAKKLGWCVTGEWAGDRIRSAPRRTRARLNQLPWPGLADVNGSIGVKGWSMRLDSWLALPGIVIHELGHYIFCRLVGTRVQQVVFFDPRGPSGFVMHAVPRRLRQHLVIVVGPLLLNSTLAFLLFRAAVTSAQAIRDRPSTDLALHLVQVLLAALLGGSIALQAIPSHADAASLWDVALDRLQAGNLLAIFVLPLAALLMLINQLRRLWIDWLYLLLTAALAYWFPWS